MQRVGLLAAAAALAGRALAQEPQAPVVELHTEPVRAPRAEITADSDASSRLAPRDPGSTLRVITRQEIDAMPGRSVADVLRTLPEIKASRLGREGTLSSLSLRGAGPGGTLVLVDGEPASDPASPAHALDLTLPLDGVERIEVLSGDASALYGPGAIGGAVNVVPRGADLGRANMQCETRYAHGERSLDAGAYRGAGRLSRVVSVGFELARAESSGAGDDTDLASEAAHLAVKLETGIGRVRLSAGYGGRDFGARGLFGDPALPSREETRTRTLGASFDGRAAGWTLAASTSLRTHHDGFLADATVSTPAPTSADTDVYRAVATGRHALLGGTLLLGMDVSRENLHATNAIASRDHMSMFMELARPFDTDAPDAGGAHVALRHDADDGYGSRLTPRLSAWISPAPGVRLHGAAGLGYRLPAFGELYGADLRGIGDPALGAETSKSLEGGAQVDAGPVTLEAVAFARRGRHVIDVEVDAAGTRRFVARDRLDVDGLTGRIATAHPVAPLVSMLALQATVLSVRNAPPAQAGTPLDPVRLRLDALVSLAHASTRLKAFTRLTYAARRSRGGAATQDARLGWATSQGDILELYVEAENLWNRDVADEPGLPLPGRRLLAGLHLTW
jgi:outer membrane cobalamin receptor